VCVREREREREVLDSEKTGEREREIEREREEKGLREERCVCVCVCVCVREREREREVLEKTCRRPLPQHRKKPARRACTSRMSYAVGMKRQYLCVCTRKRQYLYFCTNKAGSKAPVGMKRVCIASRMLWCATR